MAKKNNKRSGAPATAKPAPGQYNATNMPITKAVPTAGPLASGYVPLPSSPTPARTTPEVKGVGQGLRVAGGGGITKGELKTISDVSGKDPGKIIGRLDKINEKLAGKDKTGITLRSGAANMLIRKGSKPGRSFDFGTGLIGSALAGMTGDPGSPGAWIKGQQQGGRAAVAPTFLPQGMDLNPRGKENVRGIGKQYEVPQRFLGGEVPPPPGNDGGEVPPGGGDGGEVSQGGDGTPIIPEPEPVDTSLSSGAGGLDLASWATGFKRARSARQKAGKGAQGLGSMKKDFKFKSWNA